MSEVADSVKEMSLGNVYFGQNFDRPFQIESESELFTGDTSERQSFSRTHSELPRPIFQIRPRMYVRHTIYEIAAFCSPEEHA